MKKHITLSLIILSAVMTVNGKTVSENPVNESGTLYYFYPNGILPDDMEVPTYSLSDNHGEYPEGLSRVAILRGIDPRVNGGFLQNDINVPDFIEINGEYLYVAGVNNAFVNASCKNIFLPDGICRIESGSFMGVQSLEELTLPASLNYIGKNLFKGAKKLRTVRMRSIFPPECGVKTTSGNSITLHTGDALPDDIDVESLPFAHDNLTVYVPKGSLWIYSQHPCFKNIRLREYVAEFASPYCKEGDNANLFRLGRTGNFSLQLIDKGNGSPIKIPSEVYGLGYEMGRSMSEHPYTVTSIGGDAFSDSGIMELILPSTVQLIGDRAFTGLRLNSLFIPGSVHYIGSRAFSDSPAVRRVILNLPEDGTPFMCAEDAFHTTAEDAILYIDKSNKAFDPTVKPWCNFKEIRDISELYQ